MEKKPIRILHYIGSLNIGGSQSMIMGIYRNIDRSKVQFDFVIDRKNEIFYEDEIKSLGGMIYKLDYFNGKNYYQYKKQWNSFFINHPEYFIIHDHVRSTASIVLKIAKRHNLVTICHSHSTSNGKGIKAIVKHLLQSRIHAYADYLLACSQDSAKWLYGTKLAQSEKCFIINNSIDTKKYAYNENIRKEVRSKLNLDDKIIIGQVGRFEKMKNYDFTIEILKQLTNINNKYHLLAVGTGSQKEIIKDKISDYGLSKHVTILENRNDVNELMQAMDIYIMPSIYEGLPLSLVEAQSACLPCIISNNISAGILINDLVTKINLDEDISEWINAIGDANKIKRTDCTQLIKNSGFDINENVKKITTFYLRLGVRE